MFIGIQAALAKIFHRSRPSLNETAQNYQHHIEFGYPSNHTYKIKNNLLVPKYKLASRYKKIKPLIPNNLTSLLEVGCSKGFFIFSVNNYPNFNRGLGIDVDDYNIKVANWVNSTLGMNSITFKKMQLQELAQRIDEFGGAFQTLLIINTYQYLYFGSDYFPECYLDHDAILQHFRKICSGRIIFNNRIQLSDCQNVDRIAKATEKDKLNYTEEKFLETAVNYFNVKHHGNIGKYPLLTLDVK